ncbi:facilitated trehalose transporter Tret1-like [Coccinella septempunctata]|uniref:facilitated trehalose transporter Tret1-like n=1 Tax=Coccinella septempunctata TaxID=41139 RepID=UPI001D065BC1|nr:facilitated trehalose transporter Tret1-like [Coccinella septempunctata]
MGTWEFFASLFKSYYSTFVALTAHSIFLISCLSYAWPSPVLPKLLNATDSPLGNPITPDESDLIGAIFYIGASIGPLCFISVVNRFGRRRVLTFLSLIPPIAYGTLAFAKTVDLYIICRTLLGLYVGAVFSIQPVYLAEVLAEEERNFLMSFVTLFSFIGVFAAVTIGPFIPVTHFNGLIAILSAVVFVLVAFGFPESPYYVMQTEGKGKAKVLLRKLRQGRIENEAGMIEDRILEESEKSCCQIFANKSNFKALILATIPLLLQSSSGVALLINYSQLIFMETNISIPSHYCSIIVVGLTFSTAFLAPVLLKARRMSPVSLLMLCLAGVGLCDLIMGLYFLYGRGISFISWLPLLNLIAFVLIYNCGLDPIPWMILGNTYPVNISAVGTAISISIFEFSIFPTMILFHKVDISFLFLISSVWCVLGIVYCKFVVAPSEDKIFKTSKNGAI